MATTVPLLPDGDPLTEQWTLPVTNAIAELQDASVTAAAWIPATGITPWLGGSSFVVAQPIPPVAGRSHHVRFRIQVLNSSGAAIVPGVGAAIGTIPAGFRPVDDEHAVGVVAAAGAATPASLLIFETGVVRLEALNGAASWANGQSLVADGEWLAA